MIIETKHNQSLLDLAVQYTGSADTVMIISAKNPGVKPTDQLTSGQEIIIPQEAIDAGNNIVTNYFVTNNIIPATALQEEAEQGNDGFLTDDAGIIVDDFGGIEG